MLPSLPVNTGCFRLDAVWQRNKGFYLCFEIAENEVHFLNSAREKFNSGEKHCYFFFLPTWFVQFSTGTENSAHVQCGLNIGLILPQSHAVRVTFVMTYYCIFVFSAKYFMGEVINKQRINKHTTSSMSRLSLSLYSFLPNSFGFFCGKEIFPTLVFIPYVAI